jgi:hypothetical protein
LAIFGVEKIDLDGGGSLCDSINREREKNEDIRGNQKVFHDILPPLIIY